MPIADVQCSASHGNVIPQSGKFVSAHARRVAIERRPGARSAGSADRGDERLRADVLWHAAAVSVETERPFDADAARAVLREAPGILLHDEETAAIRRSSTSLAAMRPTWAARDDPTVPLGWRCGWRSACAKAQR
jgi:hypothetical protein